MIQYSFSLVCRDLESLLDQVGHHRLRIIEDCAHATGAHYRGQLLGTLDDIVIFSSERSNTINPIHGGQVITRDPALKTRLQQIYADTADAEPPFIQSRQAVLANQRGKLAADTLLSQEQLVPQMQPSELSGLFSPQYYWRMAESLEELLTMQLNRLPDFLRRRQIGADFQRHWSLEQLLNVDIGVLFTTPQPLQLSDGPFTISEFYNLRVILAALFYCPRNKIVSAVRYTEEMPMTYLP